MDISRTFGFNIFVSRSLLGPGGFIEALSFLRNNINDSYVGMTLIDNDVNVPGWKKSSAFLEKHKKPKNGKKNIDKIM